MILFEGKKITSEKEKGLAKSVEDLKRKNIIPKLVSLTIGNETNNLRYLNLKKMAGERIGVIVEIRKVDRKTDPEEIKNIIRKLNEDKNIHGIMIQLPLPGNYSGKMTQKIINTISRQKDVDGMRENSVYITPVVKAVESAFLVSRTNSKDIQSFEKVLIVGSKGFVGAKILDRLKKINKGDYKVFGVDIGSSDIKDKVKKADVVISATGHAGVIKDDMVKPGVTLIDVGAPQGEIDKKVYENAGFVTPVPGGIGPLTIYYLMENLVESAGIVNPN